MHINCIDQLFYIWICLCWIAPYSIDAAGCNGHFDVNDVPNYNNFCKNLNNQIEGHESQEHGDDEQLQICAIQLGILCSLETLDRRYSRTKGNRFRRLRQVENLRFPRAGSASVPRHRFPIFRFRTQLSFSFRHLRNSNFGIDEHRFVGILCGRKWTSIYNTGGKSGSLFYRSEDGRYIIKTMKHKEAQFLARFLADYRRRWDDEAIPTLLPKFFGLFSYKRVGAKWMHFMVMNNLFPADVKMHYKFDLKGSTYGRNASVEELNRTSPILKDLDFGHIFGRSGILLDRSIYRSLMVAIRWDGHFLERRKIMDYSLLLGVHNLEEGKSAEEQSAERAMRLQEMPEGIRYWYFLKINALYGPLNILPAWNSRGQKLLVYIGIIDILQTYGYRKRLEHLFKWLLFQRNFSVAKPRVYARRFHNHMAQSIFRPDTFL